jgi:elongation factor Ts
LEISAADVKSLREKTGAGVMACKRALTETQGDVGKAEELLRQQGLASAEKKANRVASQGIIDCYLHAGGRIGAMIEVNCETDFVARTPEFRALVHDLAMQVAATNPTYVRPEDIPEGVEVEPKEACLVLQPFIKEPSQTVQDVIVSAIAKVGENIRVRRFSRFELGS